MGYQGRKTLPVNKDPEVHDAFSRGGRKWLAYLTQPGVIRAIRKRFHKLARREGKRLTRADLYEGTEMYESYIREVRGLYRGYGRPL